MSIEPTAVSDVEVTPTLQANGDAPASNGSYDETSISLMQNAEHIRLRPGMYIGNTSTSGLHHLVYELVHNSVDEALAGYCKNISVKVDVDGSVSVVDDGRGIPVETHSKTGISTLEMVMTKVGSGAKFNNNTYKVSTGLHGIGAKAVTALSEWTRAEVRRNGKTYVQEYERGYASTEVREVGAANHTGTTITFKPDPEIFKDATFSYDTLESRLRELAFLNKGLALALIDARTSPVKKESFRSEGGLAEFAEWLNRGEDVLHPPVHVDKTVDQIRVEVALQYHDGHDERVRCYANNAYNEDGGMHLTGFRRALTNTLKGYGNEHKMFKAEAEPVGEDFREGLTAVISVQLPDAELESQTKVKLNNVSVEGIVAGVVSEALKKYMEEHPKEAVKIIRKVALAAEAREAAAKARDALRTRKGLLGGGGLPGKLMDCTTKDRDSSELFLVEGQSAGGTAESGRKREFQAVLPLRGKVINVEKARPEKALANEEIGNLIKAIGIDIGAEADMEKLRYGKVIILTDADVDGQHIRTLLLTFFYRQMPKLVEKGHVYVARPPLFKVTEKKKVEYIQSIDEMQRRLTARGLDSTRFTLLPRGEGEAARVFEGAELGGLLGVLTPLEDTLQLLERRGLNLASFFTRATDQGLPMHRISLGGRDEWFHTAAELDAFRREQQERLGQELVVADEPLTTEVEADGEAGGETIIIQEFHEVRKLNHLLGELRQRGFQREDLVPAARIAGRDPAPRFVVERDEVRRSLATLRELVAEIRHFGEKGLAVTRFKGLGEMDARELSETTLDPAKRTLLRVQLDDALKADEMFRTLMGEKVEPRRDFIYTHILDVKDIDWHGA